MRVIGHGIDLVEISRISEMAEKYGDKFVGRCFTQSEQDYAKSSPRRHDEHLAARFAAKEAALKALGTGWRDGIAWTDIEVIRKPSGQPVLNVTGKSKQIADKLAITEWHVSLSHTDQHAMASVMALGA